MKSPLLLLWFLGLAATALGAGAKVHPPSANSVPADATPERVASIHITGKPTAMQRAALAKISFGTALKAALAVVPGQILYGELQVDDGDLEYDFQIIDASRKLKDIAVDAGDGKILEIADAEDK